MAKKKNLNDISKFTYDKLESDVNRDYKKAYNKAADALKKTIENKLREDRVSHVHIVMKSDFGTKKEQASKDARHMVNRISPQKDNVYSLVGAIALDERDGPTETVYIVFDFLLKSDGVTEIVQNMGLELLRKGYTLYTMEIHS